MTAITYVVINCDANQCGEEADGASFNAAASRAAAAEKGWHRSGGKDICPDDWDAGWRFGRDGWTCG